ncbi:RICIN domain-containing protein [Spirillospora sp. NPDC050679]
MRKAIMTVACAAAAFAGLPSAASAAAAPGVPEALRISTGLNSGFQQCSPTSSPQFDTAVSPEFAASVAGGPNEGLTGRIEVARPGGDPFIRQATPVQSSGTTFVIGTPPGSFSPGSYQFRFRAEDGNQMSAWSAWCSFQVTGSAFPAAAYSPDGGRHCLDVAGASKAEGARVRLWRCNGTDAQKWRRFAAGTFVNAASGKCLDVIGDAGFAFDAKTEQATCDGTPNQTWQSVAGSGLRNGASRNVPVCLDIPAGLLISGNAVQVHACNASPAQRWEPVTAS